MHRWISWRSRSLQIMPLCIARLAADNNIAPNNRKDSFNGGVKAIDRKRMIELLNGDYLSREYQAVISLCELQPGRWGVLRDTWTSPKRTRKKHAAEELDHALENFSPKSITSVECRP